jgi:hypothetical protein
LRVSGEKKADKARELKEALPAQQAKCLQTSQPNAAANMPKILEFTFLKFLNQATNTMRYCNRHKK